MPATAVEPGVADRFDPLANLGGGADYLARQMLHVGDLPGPGGLQQRAGTRRPPRAGAHDVAERIKGGGIAGSAEPI